MVALVPFKRRARASAGFSGPEYFKRAGFSGPAYKKIREACCPLRDGSIVGRAAPAGFHCGYAGGGGGSRKL